MKTLMVGFGNPMRSDDGIGPYVVDRISTLEIPDVDVRICHQLGVELIDDVRSYDRIIFVDAGGGPKPYRFRRVRADAPSAASSHYLSPETLYRLAQKLVAPVPPFYLCTVGVADFAFGEGFSEKAVRSAHGAIDFLKGRLTRGIHHA